MTDPNTPDPGDTPPETPDPQPEEQGGRYALYDRKYLRYVGGVHDTKTAAQDSKPEKAERGRFEVRKVG